MTFISRLFVDIDDSVAIGGEDETIVGVVDDDGMIDDELSASVNNKILEFFFKNNNLLVST